MRLLHAARLSQAREGQTGIESADKACQEWATRNGHQIVHVSADTKSGTSAPWERKNLRPWVTDPVKISSYDGIIAYRLDRLSRGDDESTSAIEQWARDHGKILLTEDGLIYPCEGADGIRWDVTKRIAHEEWLKTSERYSRMQAHLRSQNFLTGRPPFGFMVAESGEHKTLAPDPVTGPILVSAIDMYLSGKSLRNVCDWLDTQVSTPQGGNWQSISLSKIFRNECLTGRRKDGNGRTILKFKGLITTDKFDKLQAMMSAKATRKGIAPANTAMLTSMAFCSVCGGPMYRSNAYYRCHGVYPADKPCGLLVKITELDEFVSALFDPDRMGSRMEIETITVAGEGYETEIAELERDIRELDLDDPAYDSKLARMRDERSRLKALPARPTVTQTRETGRTWHQVWTGLDDGGKRRWLLDAGLRLVVSKDMGNHSVQWNMDSPYLVYAMTDM